MHKRSLKRPRETERRARADQTVARTVLRLGQMPSSSIRSVGSAALLVPMMVWASRFPESERETVRLKSNVKSVAVNQSVIALSKSGTISIVCKNGSEIRAMCKPERSHVL